MITEQAYAWLVARLAAHPRAVEILKAAGVVLLVLMAAPVVLRFLGWWWAIWLPNLR